MRTQEAIDAWREVLELDAGRLPRAGGAGDACSRRRRAGRSAVDVLERRARALASPEDQVDVLMQAASTSGPTRSATAVRRPRSTSASCRSIPATRRRRSSSSSSTASARAGMKLVELLLSRTEFVARRGGAHPAARADRRDLRAAAGRSRQRVRDAAGGVPRGLLQRPRRQGAGAAGHGGRQVERAASATTPRWCRGSPTPSRPPTCG